MMTQERRFLNPVLRGFYPDPSVCRVGDNYYMVCSSFHYFPGLPLFESDDLIKWKPIGHCLNRKSQLNLSGVRASGGLFAPTIRYHEGRFYVVVTDVTGGGNLMIYTDDIHGEWSQPIYIDRPGIDPSLLFDEGKVYFMSNGEDDAGEAGISLCEIDIHTGQVLTPSRCITKGTGGRFVEGPHLYHIGEYYYLLVAEGGTEYGHMECLLRGRNPYGPYESCPHNPILTNRNMGGYLFQGAGHADLIDDGKGNWYMVHLAFRQMGNWRMYHQLGRETCLEPCRWDAQGWLHVGVDGVCRAGYALYGQSVQALEVTPFQRERWRLDPLCAAYVRCPNEEDYRIDDPARFALRGVKDTLCGTGNVTFIGMRQREFDTEFVVNIRLEDLKPGMHAGITAYMDENSHYDLDATSDGTGFILSARAVIGGLLAPMGEWRTQEKEAELRISACIDSYSLYARLKGREQVLLGKADAKYISSEVAEGFTGVMLAAYCEAAHDAQTNFVRFEVPRLTQEDF